MRPQRRLLPWAFDRHVEKLFSGNLSANQLDKFISGRHTPGLLLGVDLFAIDQDIQCARGAKAQTS